MLLCAKLYCLSVAVSNENTFILWHFRWLAGLLSNSNGHLKLQRRSTHLPCVQPRGGQIPPTLKFFATTKYRKVRITSSGSLFMTNNRFSPRLMQTLWMDTAYIALGAKLAAICASRAKCTCLINIKRVVLIYVYFSVVLRRTKTLYIVFHVQCRVLVFCYGAE